MDCKPRKRKVVDNKDKKQIVQLGIDNQLPVRKIEQLTGVSKTRVAEIIADARTNPEYLEFTQNKDKVFEGLQQKLINLADDDLLKTMLSKRGLTDVGILEDKIRLIRGQATEITDVRSLNLSARIDDLLTEKTRLTTDTIDVEADD